MKTLAIEDLRRDKITPVHWRDIFSDTVHDSFFLYVYAYRDNKIIKSTNLDYLHYRELRSLDMNINSEISRTLQRFKNLKTLKKQDLAPTLYESSPANRLIYAYNVSDQTIFGNLFDRAAHFVYASSNLSPHQMIKQSKYTLTEVWQGASIKEFAYNSIELDAISRPPG